VAEAVGRNTEDLKQTVGVEEESESHHSIPIGKLSNCGQKSIVRLLFSTVPVIRSSQRFSYPFVHIASMSRGGIADWSNALMDA
jgi:hypothetical protein